MKTNFKALNESDVQKIAKLNDIALKHNFLIFEEGQPGTNNLSQWTKIFLMKNNSDTPMDVDEVCIVKIKW